MNELSADVQTSKKSDILVSLLVQNIQESVNTMPGGRDLISGSGKVLLMHIKRLGVIKPFTKKLEFSNLQ